jgi:hypothetical protein
MRAVFGGLSAPGDPNAFTVIEIPGGASALQARDGAGSGPQARVVRNVGRRVPSPKCPLRPCDGIVARSVQVIVFITDSSGSSQSQFRGERLAPQHPGRAGMGWVWLQLHVSLIARFYYARARVVAPSLVPAAPREGGDGAGESAHSRDARAMANVDCE